ncbi:hypothetical protein [Eubacterium sp. BL-380-WT-2B]|nr:hypothetical protein [Eubacterium sp. BL-380-WT-2B]
MMIIPVEYTPIFFIVALVNLSLCFGVLFLLTWLEQKRKDDDQ